MANICSRKCQTEGCGKQPSFEVVGTKKGEYCAQHAPDGMVHVRSRKCRTEGCGKQPSFGVASTKPAEYCAQHALNGMVDVYRRKYRIEGCGKQPSFGVAGIKTAEYCAQHAPDGMVDLYRRKCRTENCDNRPSFGVAGTKTGEYCVRSTHRTGWSTSGTESTEPMVAASDRLSEWPTQRRWSTVNSTPDYNTVSKDTGRSLGPSRSGFRGRQAFVFGRVAVANACSSDNFMSRQLYCMKFSYEVGSHCMGRGG